MNYTQAGFLDDVTRVSRDLWSKGWAERNAGNISIRLSPDEIDRAGIDTAISPWMPLNKPVPGTAGDFYLVSGSGKYFRNVEVAPEICLGIIEIDGEGQNYRKVWGLTDGGNPTSELIAHLEAHSMKKSGFKASGNTVIHTHPTNIVALSYLQSFETHTFTKLIWEMHTECIIVLPEGIEFLPFMLPGSNEIADATYAALKKRNLVIWQFHGALAAGPDPDTTFGLIDTAEKAAEIYLKARSAGGIYKTLSLDDLGRLAKSLGITPDREIWGKIQTL